MKNFENLIFDMGNVLLRYEPETFIEREKIENPEDRELLLNNIFRSPNWIKLDSGEWDEEDLEVVALEKLPKHLHEVAKRLIHKWHDPILPMEGMYDLLKKCKNSGYKIYLLSNASRAQSKYWDRVPGNELFDGVVVSANLKLMKPDEKIFKYIINEYNLDPEKTLFIDDMQRNLDGAAKLSISTFLFNGNVEELEEYIFGGN
ncbi:HAD family hydrolase [Helcococcus kunzii]|uniref:HAD family hydrolase n=1 Tax=Helcococcus kunzii TaxID=40091 RepID=UPI0038AB6436